MSMHHAKNLDDHVGYTKIKHILIFSCQLELEEK